jgi:hypothetical protein
MSMCLSLMTLSDENIQRLLKDPPLVWQAVAPEDSEMYEAARGEEATHSFLSKLFGRARPPADVPDLTMSSAEGHSTDLDKAWHGIHYLLTGTSWEGEHPRNFLVSGGTAVGKIDVGYGPARTLTAIETRQVHATLAALSDEQLTARFNPKDMLAKKIYPEMWDSDPADDDTLGYLMEYVQALRGFVGQAANDGVGLLVYLS